MPGVGMPIRKMRNLLAIPLGNDVSNGYIEAQGVPALSRRRAFVRSLERLRIGFSSFWIPVWKEYGEVEFRI
jgi:hypothetical protein